jgi:GNAT superfamily N-acetyltransferase
MQCSIHPQLKIVPGTAGDYHALKAFHYRAGHPGAIKRIFAARYHGPGMPAHEKGGMLAGVVVESLPALACFLRQQALPGVFDLADRSLNAAKLNRDLRTISRVIVHPIFRSAGLAVQLVKHVLANADTPYIEALAAMGRIHPFFKRAGMIEFDRPPLPSHVRLVAALAHEGLSPLDLSRPLTPSPFLQRELQRFTHLPADASDGALLSRAGASLLSQPLYYLWQSEGVRAPCVATQG